MTRVDDARRGVTALSPLPAPDVRILKVGVGVLTFCLILLPRCF